MDITASINGKISGELSIRKIAYYHSTGERMCTAVLRTKITEPEAVDNFGELFADVAFSGLQKDGEEITHGFKSISTAFVFSKHLVEICGKKFPVKPEVPKISSVEGEELVELEIVIPLPITLNTKEFYSEFLLAIGSTQEAEFAVEQIEIPGTGPQMSIVKGGSEKPEQAATSRPKGSHGPQSQIV